MNCVMEASSQIQVHIRVEGTLAKKGKFANLSVKIVPMTSG